MAPSKRKSKPGSVLLNLISFLFMAASILLVAYFWYTYTNPYHPLNPFAPPAPAAESQAEANVPAPLPTETIEVSQFLSETVDPPAPTPTDVPVTGPTATIPAYPTATSVVLNTPEPTLTAETLTFVVEPGTPRYQPHPGGCDGLYIAGHITDIDNNPLVHMTVQVSGVLNEELVFIEAFSGTNTNYTISGWEIKLADMPVDSYGAITVALYEQGGWEPISEEVVIDTFNDCSRNLVEINFIQQ